jgi:hypothetical protein
MSDGTGHAPPPPPPSPPPPAHVVEVRTVHAGDVVDGALQPLAVPTHRRGNRDPVAEGQPPGGDIVGECDRCGATGAELVSWRVQLGRPPEVTVRGLCAACAAGPSAIA